MQGICHIIVGGGGGGGGFLTNNMQIDSLVTIGVSIEYSLAGVGMVVTQASIHNNWRWQEI